MDDAGRVRASHSVGDLEGVTKRWPFPGFQHSSRHIFHDDEFDSAVLSPFMGDIVDRNNVGMIQRRRDARFAGIEQRLRP
jgi:hypothetical protein